jgi:hypothetical protein
MPCPRLPDQSESQGGGEEGVDLEHYVIQRELREREKREMMM